MACVKGIAKFVVITINLVLLIISIIMTSFGIASSVNPGGLASMFEDVLPATVRAELQHAGVDLIGVILSNAVFMIVVGIIGIVCSGLGCFGACCMIKWMLGLYAIVVSCLLLAEIALVIFASVYPNKFKSFMQESMLTTLKDGFKDEMHVNGTVVVMPTGVVELAWANIQLKEQCCGAYGRTDYSTLSNWNNTGLVPPSVFSGAAAVPISCCKLKNPSSLDQPSNLMMDSFTDLSKCLRNDSSSINQQNCFDAIEGDIEKFIHEYKGIAIGTAASLAGFEILLVLLAVYLCKTSETKIVYIKYA